MESNFLLNVKIFNFKFALSFIYYKETLNNEPSDENNFVNSGGTSIKAVLFVENLEHKLYPKLLNKSNKILDVLLHEKFENLVQIVESLVNNEMQSPDISAAKKQKLNNATEKYTYSDISLSENILCYYSKLNHYISNKFNCNQMRQSKLDLKINWKYDTFKCIDATPLIVCFKNQDKVNEYVLIGSHSHQFICLNAINGDLIWKFETNGKILKGFIKIEKY